MDPNSKNQRWSRWRFRVRDAGRIVPRADVELNFARWARAGFGSVTKAKIDRDALGWILTCVTEGATAEDLGYVMSVRSDFERKFLFSGFGPMASVELTTCVLAGDTRSGPASQWVEIPTIPLAVTSGDQR